MGQIQNAILNALGSAQQISQFYKLTDTYAKGLKEQSEKEAKSKYSRFLERSKVDAEILKEPLSEEEKAKYEEQFKDVFTRREGESERAFGGRRKYGTEKMPGLARATENLYETFSGDFLSDEYKELVRRREFISQKNRELDKQRKKELNLLRQAQEIADTNENITNSRAIIKGGKK